MHVRGVDGVSQASTHRHTNSLADERAELRARPAGRLEQRRGQLARLALVEPAHEGSRLAAERAKDRPKEGSFVTVYLPQGHCAIGSSHGSSSLSTVAAKSSSTWPTGK